MTAQPLTPGHTAALLLASLEMLREEAEAFGPEEMRWHPAKGEWCLNEVVAHILEAEERGFAGRIRRIIEQPGRELIDWDPPSITKARGDCEKSGAELIAELVQERERSVELLRGLSDEQLPLSGNHPQVDDLSVAELLHEWVHHDREHVKQALAITQAYAWEHMGNTRRFGEID
jgi:hypothetical protein